MTLIPIYVHRIVNWSKLLQLSQWTNVVIQNFWWYTIWLLTATVFHESVSWHHKPHVFCQHKLMAVGTNFAGLVESVSMQYASSHTVSTWWYSATLQSWSVCHWLSKNYPRCCIGCGCETPVSWLMCLPDLNIFNFHFLWG